MAEARPLSMFFIVVPAVAAAAGVLGYFTWETASHYAELGQRSIAHSTLLLVEEKVDRVEKMIISQDNAVFHLVDLADPEALAETWRPLASRISPSVRAVVVVGPNDRPLTVAARANAKERRNFSYVFRKRLLPELKRGGVPGQLHHLHTRVRARNYLISYKTMEHEGEPYLVAAHHDTGYIVREEFSQLWASEQAQSQYNVIDDENRRVYGESLLNAGEFVVGRRFPTTLYRWRLQVAPRDAPLLEAQARSQELTKAAMIGLSFIVVLLGIVFLLNAAIKERRLNVMKSDFIANVSHELKTPLSVVRMFGEMLSTDRVRSEEKRKEYAELIVRESERLTALIENVLDFSAVERGKQTYELVEADLEELVSRAMETVRHRAEREGIEVSLLCDPHLPRAVLDEQSVLLAAINLIDNAVKYGGGTPIEVSVHAERGRMTVTVRDHGPGVQDGDQKRIFERFYRARSKEQVRGSGIGLSLVQNIAEAHGGRAWARNHPEGGAVVSFSLAVTTPSSRRATAPKQEGATEPTPANAALTAESGRVSSAEDEHRGGAEKDPAGRG